MSERPDDAELDNKLPSHCDQELRDLRSVQEALERRISLVSRKRNTFSWINTLPPKLLVDIFAIAIGDGEPGPICSDHATLSLVCQHWNHLVDTTPSLWTKIHTETMSMRKVIRALEKSQDAPLDILCTSWAFVPPMRDAFLDVLIPHAHRWREVSLALGQADQTLEKIATLATPLLEVLDLSIGRYFEWVSEKPLDLFGGRPPPRLQKLCLEGVPVPWSPTVLCHLTLLSISHIGHLGPSLDQFMAVLSACPDLESISLFEVSFSGGVSTSSPNPVHMLALETVKIRRQTPQITNRLLASIKAPNCKYFFLYCDVVGDPLQELFTSDVSHFFDPIRSNPNAGSITCRRDGLFIDIMGLWHISIGMENIAFAKDIIVWLSLSPQSRVHFAAFGVRPGPPLEDLMTFAGDMEGVYRLAFRAGTPPSKALQLLANCSLVQGRNWGSFPTLEEMSIADDVVGDDYGNLLLMLRRRKEAQDTQDNSQHPKSLRKLELGADWGAAANDPLITNFSSTYWPDHMDEVRRLLGPEGELIWYGRIVTEEGVLEDQVVSEGGS